MKAAKLLEQADTVLKVNAASGQSARMAAFLARQALEDVIDVRCLRLDARARGASTRSQLSILRSLDDPDLARRAATAWHRLSNACHLHAYEMQPSVAEVQHLCGVVAGLIPAQYT